MKLIRYFLFISCCTVAFAAQGAESSSPKDADNTARNDRDRNQKEATPLDQGKSTEDLATTKRIRQAIIADKSVSSNGHNVKIITSGGQVTLRGPVNTEEEKQIIEALAASATSAARVTSQLEVKSDTNKK